MANDSFNWDVIIRLATQGAKGSADDLERVGSAVDHLSRQGKLAEKSTEQLTRRLESLGKAAQSASKANLSPQEKLFERQDRLYTNYLEKQEKGYAEQDRIYNDYLSSQTAGLQKKADAENTIRERQDRLYNEYLSTQTANLKKQADERVKLETQANAKLESAGSKRLDQERSLSRERNNRDLRAFDREFESLVKLTSQTSVLEDRAISLRYANQDLAQSMFTVSAAITAAGVGAVTAFASQERAFADVIRTTTDDVSGLEDAFRSLSTEIPNSFNQLAEIGTLGNQLGVSGDQLQDFTRTIAEFSTVTGISAEESALAFGKLGNLLGVLPEDYDRLASSIALVGRETAATEKQIISVAGEIAPAAAAAGFTADQVVGLSGALASLKVPPERSRSTILQFFETLNMAVASGGDKLENFATVIGTTSAELEAMVRAGQGKDILTRFVGNVSSADTIEVTRALEALGLAGLRTNPTIRALAKDVGGLNEAISIGLKGWTENNELQRQMAIIMETLSAKFQVFLNAALNTAATIGSAVAPAFAQLLTVATDLLVGLQEFAASDFGQGFFRIVGAIGAAVAAYTALRGIIALASASLFTFVTISKALGGAGIISGLQGMASAFGLIRGSAEGAAAGTSKLRVALLALGKATVILGVLQLAIELFTNFGGVLYGIGGVMVNVGKFFVGLQKQIGAFASTVGSALAFISPLLSVFGIFVGNSTGLSKGLVDAGKGLQKFGASLGASKNQMDGFRASTDALDFGAFDEGAGDLGNLGDAAGGAAKEVRTLVDYANDLRSVFSRAFDIRFGSESTLDKITQQFRDIQKASEESARNIQKLKAEIQGLQSDIGIQQYFLGIAVEYGDSKRAEAIQANIAKLQADLASKTADLSAEQAKNSKELTGNSDAALANRQTMESLVQAYQEHLTALASSGLSQQELARRAAELKAQFIQQATQIGFNTTEVLKYASSFDDLITIINNVPRNITVTANVNPALQALNEFVAAAQRAGSAAGSGISSGIASGLANADYNVRTLGQGVGRTIGTVIGGGIREGLDGTLGRSLGSSVGRYPPYLYASGGYTGRGGMYEPAGIVHRGEYVVPKKDVNQRTGLPYADALGRLQKGTQGRSGYAQGGYVSGSGMSGAMQLASLGPMAQQQFGQLFDAYMKTYLDGQVIAQSSSRQYAESTRVGAA